MIRPALPLGAGRRPPLAAALAGCLAVAALAGCGRRDLHRVEGVVRFADGAPLTAGRVVLDYGPQAVHGGWGYVRSDGEFTLGSFAENDGVRAGTVRVVIVDASAPKYAPDGGLIGLTPLVHPRFANPDTSGLSFEIPRQKRWEIVVERP